MGTRIWGATLAAVAALAVVTAPAVAAAEGRLPGVVGSAGGPLTFPGYPGQPVRFDVVAEGKPGTGTGRFHVNHKTAEGGPYADFDGRVDCVAVQGNLAIVTGVVERADLPGVPGVELVGRRIGLTFQQNPGPDRIGWSWAYGSFEQDVLPCTGAVPFFETAYGGYLVRG
ncbi:hypothetical protein [Amycolatopsis magusensis]|uniref:hypothetical protein n=1 Tax=Amycolatopsis magusensis TaxID=882444 RepID=UPI003C2B4041